MLKSISVECLECLNEDAKKKKRGQIPYIRSGDGQITTSAKSLDIMYKFYEFSGDLIEIIN